MNKEWNLKEFFETDEDFENELKSISSELDTLEELSENIGDNFLEFFTKVFEIMPRFEIGAYSTFNLHKDMREPKSQDMASRVDSLSDRFSLIISGLEPYILSLSDEDAKNFISENNLDIYKNFFDKILRNREHVLSESEEKIINAFKPVAGGYQESYTMLKNADLEFPKLESKDVKLTEANYVDLLKDEDREVREETFTKYYETMRKTQNTTASLLKNNVKALTIEAKLRGFNSAREMELFTDNVDTKVYDNLIDAVHESFDTIHEYYKIKKEKLGLEKMHMYDVYLPMSSESSKKIEFEEARDIVLEAFKPLGEEYIEVLKEGFENNWIDVYPSEGKINGAYSWGVYDRHPFVLLNHTDNLDSLFTLAHELGHAMHSYYSNKNNDFVNSDYTIFAAEVASTTNELLLLNYLLDNTKSDEERFYLLDHYADSFKQTVFRQTMFAEFEKITHEKTEKGEALTLESFNEIYYGLNKKYFGEHVISDKEIEFEWARIPHFYRNFYVYKYSTGFLSAVVLSEKILRGTDEDKENYLNFLKDGSNHFPIDQLRSAGVKIDEKETLKSSLDVFRKVVDELKESI